MKINIEKNHKLFNQKLKGLLKNMDENRSPYEIESASSIGVFLRSYHHIEKIDVKNKFHIRAVLLYNKCVLESCRYLSEKKGFKVTYLPVNTDGLIDLNLLKKSIFQKSFC